MMHRQHLFGTPRFFLFASPTDVFRLKLEYLRVRVRVRLRVRVRARVRARVRVRVRVRAICVVGRHSHGQGDVRHCSLGLDTCARQE